MLNYQQMRYIFVVMAVISTVPVVPPCSPGPCAVTMPGSPISPGSPTRTLNGLPGMWHPLNLTSMEWTPFSRGMKRIAFLSEHEGQHKWRCYWSATHKWCSQIKKKPELCLLKSTLYNKVRLVRTAVKLSDIAFLRRAGGGVDFGVNYTSSPVALHHERCLLVYLQVLLLQKTGKNIIRIYVCVYAYACVCGRTFKGHKVCDSSCLSENRLRLGVRGRKGQSLQRGV